MRNHSRVIHGTKKKKWNCPDCGKLFSRKPNLRKHINSAHPSADIGVSMEMTTFQYVEKKREGFPHCKICNQSFARKENFQSHMTSYHANSSISPQTHTKLELTRSNRTKGSNTIVNSDREFSKKLTKLILENHHSVTKTIDFALPSEFIDYNEIWSASNQNFHRLYNFTEIEENIYSKSIKPAQPHDLPKCNCKNECNDFCLNRLSFVECSLNTCRHGCRCTNSRIQKNIAAHVECFITSNKGRGVRASHFINNGEYIIEYKGEVITQHELKNRMESLYKDYKHHYCMTLENDLVIDSYTKGNISRYINHSCSPNCIIEKWMVEGRPRIAIFAMKNIQQGEELTYDYNFSQFDHCEFLVCKCESANCGGYLDQSVKNKKMNYLGANSNPISHSKAIVNKQPSSIAVNVKPSVQKLASKTKPLNKLYFKFKLASKHKQLKIGTEEDERTAP